MGKDKFVVSALVDFADDYIDITFTPDLVDDLIDRLQWMGATRVYWNFYQRGVVDYLSTGTHGAETHANLGEPIAAGARSAHERGMEFFATIKPYETGATHANPANSPRILAHPGLPGIGGVYIVDDWVLARPELRVKARAADLPVGIDDVPVRRIQLRQKDMTPVRIGREHLEIWTSADNVCYRKKDVSFDLSESVAKCPADIRSMQGDHVSSKGDSVRVLDLTGLDLQDPFIAVTTTFDDDEGTFANTAFEMVRAYGPGDRPVPIVVASHKAVWRPNRDFRTGDLEYDAGVGDEVVRLDVSNSCPGSSGSDGVIAFARGRNEYLSGSVCEAYPEVQGVLARLGGPVHRRRRGRRRRAHIVPQQLDEHPGDIWLQRAGRAGVRAPVRREPRHGAVRPRSARQAQGRVLRHVPAGREDAPVGRRKEAVGPRRDGVVPPGRVPGQDAQPAGQHRVRLARLAELRAGRRGDVVQQGVGPGRHPRGRPRAGDAGRSQSGGRSDPPEPPGRARRHVHAGQAGVRLQERKAGRVLLLRDGVDVRPGKTPGQEGAAEVRARSAGGDTGTHDSARPTRAGPRGQLGDFSPRPPTLPSCPRRRESRGWAEARSSLSPPLDSGSKAGMTMTLPKGNSSCPACSTPAPRTQPVHPE